MQTTETERKTMETKDMKQVQCADCLRWVNAEKNHTCRQQVGRNRRWGKKGS